MAVVFWSPRLSICTSLDLHSGERLENLLLDDRVMMDGEWPCGLGFFFPFLFSEMNFKERTIMSTLLSAFDLS